MALHCIEWILPEARGYIEQLAGCVIVDVTSNRPKALQLGVLERPHSEQKHQQRNSRQVQTILSDCI